jgi:hypothetical protein
MKKLLFVAAVLCFWVSAQASIYLAWDANSEADLAGYKIYAGPDSAEMTSLQELGAEVTRWEVPDSLWQLTHFAVTAVNYSGMESDFSDIIVREIFAISYEQNSLEFYVPANEGASVYINGKLFADIYGTPGDTVAVILPRITAYGGECVVELSTGAAYAFELFVTGDTNHDGIVGVLDQAAFDYAFGSTTESLRYNIEFDFDRDGDVDVFDQVEFDKIFGMVKNE